MAWVYSVSRRPRPPRRPRVVGTPSTRATRLGVRAERCARVTTHARNASVLVTQAPRTSQVFGRCDAGNRVGPQYLCAQNKGTYTASIFAGLSRQTLQFLRDRCESCASFASKRATGRAADSAGHALSKRRPLRGHRARNPARAKEPPRVGSRLTRSTFSRTAAGSSPRVRTINRERLRNNNRKFTERGAFPPVPNPPFPDT